MAISYIMQGVLIINSFEKVFNYSNLTKKDGIYISSEAEGKDIAFPNAHDYLFSLEDKSYWFEHRNRIIAKCIDGFPPENKMVVDVGGGNGCTALYLQKSGYSVALFEPLIEGAINAKSRGVNNVFATLYNAENVLPESVSSVGLFDVLEHIEDEDGFLQTICSTLKPNGKLYITVPAHKLLWSSSDNCGHYRRYTQKKLIELMQRNHFKVAYSSYFFWWLPLPIFLFRALPYKITGGKIIPGVVAEQSEDDNGSVTRQFVMPSFVNKIIHFISKGELTRIDKRRPTKIGASIVLVAQKSSEPSFREQ